jgi:hypothetical protein
MILRFHPFFSFLYCRFFSIQFFLSCSQFLLHSIQEESLSTSQTHKNTHGRNGGEKEKEIMLGVGERRGAWSFDPLKGFLDAWELRFPPLFPGISECQKGPQHTFPSPK